MVPDPGSTCLQQAASEKAKRRSNDVDRDVRRGSAEASELNRSPVGKEEVEHKMLLLEQMKKEFLKLYYFSDYIGHNTFA